MTIVRSTRWFLECNCMDPKCVAHDAGQCESASDATKSQARESAIADGWVVTQGGRIAYCAPCRPCYRRRKRATEIKPITRGEISRPIVTINEGAVPHE